MVISFSVPGEPKGKGRPRLGRSGHTYTPHDTAAYENLVKVCFRDKFPEHIPLDSDVAVKVEIWAGYSMPKSASKKKQHEMRLNIIHPLKKPDCDNIAKIICDALNGIAYHDDSQIYNLTVRKFYSGMPQVSVKMEWEDGTES